MSSYQELLLYTKQLERRLSKLEWQETNVSVAGGDHGTLSGLGDDDHTQYLLASAAGGRTAFGTNWTDLTDAGATTLHKHDHGGMDGLGDDDHTIYLLASAATNRTTFATNWGLLTGAGSTTLHTHSHANIGNLSSDDHTQYLLASAATNRTAFATNWGLLTGSGSTTLHTHSHANLGNLSADDHSQYALLAGRSGGQTLNGGTAANDDLTLQGTTNGTRATSYIIMQPNGGYVGVGTTAPTVPMMVLHNAGSNSNIVKTLALADDRTDRYASLDVIRDAASYLIGLGFSTSNNAAPAERMRITYDGNVGIGTTAPSQKLDVNGVIKTRGDQLLFEGGSGLGADQGDSTATLYNRSGVGPTFSGYQVAFRTGATPSETMRIDPNNRLGIGTAAPEQKLHVSGGYILVDNGYYYAGKNASGTNISLLGINASNDVYMGAIANAGGKVHIREDGADVITLHAANVGIGTTAPVASAKLQVEGKVGIKTGVNAISAQLMVYQDSTTAAIAVADLIQDDVSEEFINFRATEGTGNPIDTAALGSYAKKVRVSANGTFYWLALYN